MTGNRFLWIGTILMLLVLALTGYIFRTSLTTNFSRTEQTKSFNNVLIGEHIANVVYKLGKPDLGETANNIKKFDSTELEVLNDRVVAITYRCPTSHSVVQLLGVQCEESEQRLLERFGEDIKQVCSIDFPTERFFIVEKKNVYYVLSQAKVTSMTLTAETPLNYFNVPWAVNCSELNAPR